jgi:hypothetical protein
MRGEAEPEEMSQRKLFKAQWEVMQDDKESHDPADNLTLLALYLRDLGKQTHDCDVCGWTDLADKCVIKSCDCCGQRLIACEDHAESLWIEPLDKYYCVDCFDEKANGDSDDDGSDEDDDDEEYKEGTDSSSDSDSDSKDTAEAVKKENKRSADVSETGQVPLESPVNAKKIRTVDV